MYGHAFIHTLRQTFTLIDISTDTETHTCAQINAHASDHFFFRTQFIFQFPLLELLFSNLCASLPSRLGAILHEWKRNGGEFKFTHEFPIRFDIRLRKSLWKNRIYAHGRAWSEVEGVNWRPCHDLTYTYNLSFDDVACTVVYIIERCLVGDYPHNQVSSE